MNRLRTAVLALIAMLFVVSGCTAGLPAATEPPLPDDDDSPGLDDDDTTEPEVDDDDTTEEVVDDDDTTDPIDDDDTTEEPTPDELPPTDFDTCFADIAADPEDLAPNYDQFGPTVGSHCNGTNHQAITGVERVVFLGDSVTVGTPPTADAEFYRNRLALQLATEFGLEAPGPLWQGVNILSGMSLLMEDGDFASCAKWGARADDLMQDNSQVVDCLPESERDKVTLVVMTVGGNDLSSLTSGFMEGEPTEDLWAETYSFMQLVRDTVEWIKAPGRFPNGVYVVTTNLYEFTDATGDVTACPMAGLAGFDAAVTDPALTEMVIWAMEEFMSIATDTGTDMLFLLESFCGHGFNYDDPTGRCYRGADAENWFDLTCIHPNPTGHQVISDMFMSVVTE